MEIPRGEKNRGTAAKIRAIVIRLIIPPEIEKINVGVKRFPTIIPPKTDFRTTTRREILKPSR